MRILFLTGQVPYPPHAGGALRTFGLLHGLHDQGHTLDLLTFSEPGLPDPTSTPLSVLCRQIITLPTPHRTISARLRDLMMGHADMEGRSWSPAFAEKLKSQLAFNDYDLIHIESLEMATYLPIIKTRRPALPVIYDSFNAEYDLQRLIFDIDRRNLARLPIALYSLLQWRRLTRWERKVCRQVDRVIAVSDADAQAFRTLAPDVKVHVVPNGIYTDEYRRPSKLQTQQLELGAAALLFTGSMGYRPNVDAVLWFADHILAEIRKVMPNAQLFVVGNNPHPRLDKLRQREDVQITGYVQDVLPFLHSAAVYVAPLRMGSGTRLKLLQAMAAGCPIVSTSVGAQGLDVTSGHEMMLAEDEESFARATVTLLNDHALRDQLTSEAYKLVCEKYDWAAILPRLLSIYREMGLSG